MSARIVAFVVCLRSNGSKAIVNDWPTIIKAGSALNGQISRRPFRGLHVFFPSR